MKYNRQHFSKIISNSKNISDACRKLNGNTGCGNRQTVKKYIRKYNLDVSHFSNRIYNNINNFKKIQLSEILIKNSTFSKTHLKDRLYDAGIKERICEKCGQDENWNGEHMSLILDHENGVDNDNRIKNLKILCPNCNATLPTHGGKNKTTFSNIKISNICICGESITNNATMCIKCRDLKQQTVVRPPYDILIKEIKEIGYVNVGKKYGVSDNAIRKWVKKYEREI